jgi:hypothetical protein
LDISGAHIAEDIINDFDGCATTVSGSIDGPGAPSYYHLGTSSIADEVQDKSFVAGHTTSPPSSLDNWSFYDGIPADFDGQLFEFDAAQAIAISPRSRVVWESNGDDGDAGAGDVKDRELKDRDVHGTDIGERERS